MPSLPDMNGDVFFGDAVQELPDWREKLPEEKDDSDELTSEEREAVIGMIGFDPSEIVAAKEDKAKSSTVHIPHI